MLTCWRTGMLLHGQVSCIKLLSLPGQSVLIGSHSAGNLTILAIACFSALILLCYLRLAIFGHDLIRRCLSCLCLPCLCLPCLCLSCLRLSCLCLLCLRLLCLCPLYLRPSPRLF